MCGVSVTDKYLEIVFLLQGHYIIHRLIKQHVDIKEDRLWQKK